MATVDQREYYLVICRDDRPSLRRKGAYVLATRRVFWDRMTAAVYLKGINASREPLIIAGRFGGLRFGEADMNN